MTETTIPLSKLEAINDMIADGIDAAGDGAEVFLAKTLFHLSAHCVSVEMLGAAIETSLKDPLASANAQGGGSGEG